VTAGDRRPPAAAPRSRLSRRGRVLLALVLAALVVLAVDPGLPGAAGRAVFGPGTPATLGGRIVAAAQSQVGVATDPSHSYCNPYSAYWHAGAGGCPSGEASEQWCADFAAWAWQKGGAEVPYGFGPGDLNSGAGSFYTFALARGTWHPAGSGYVAQPGDVAVYGLDPGTGSAQHVAVVTAVASGAAGPDVINGDGDRTGYSVVESGTDQTATADGRGGQAVLAGYASPVPAPVSAEPRSGPVPGG
jgi:hypothetical protein